MIRSDASEIFDLSATLGDIAAKAVPETHATMAEAGEQVQRVWQRAAASTHDSHAKHYAGSIDSEILPGFSSIAVEIGPNRAKKQGFLGRILEFGGERSPAYLLGATALSESEGRTERAIAKRIDSLF